MGFCDRRASPETIDSHALDQELARVVAAVVDAKAEARAEAPTGSESRRIPVGGRVWALYTGDQQWYEGTVTKIVSRNRYMVKFDGYDGNELCSEIEEQPDPEKEKQRILDSARLKVDLVRTHHPRKGGATILHVAARNGIIPLVKWLLKRGANVAAKDSGGFSALHVAARHNQYQIVAFLLDKGGAKLGRMRSHLTRETAWDVAKWAGADEVCKLIENRTNTQRMRELQDHALRSH